MNILRFITILVLAIVLVPDRASGQGEWTSQTSGGTVTFTDIRGLDASNVWAVGYAGFVKKWDGTAWQVLPQGTPNHLQAVLPFAANNVWMSGDAGTMLQWNGTNYTSYPTGVQFALGALWGPDPNNIWAVGVGGAIRKWNGTSWTAQTSGTGNGLGGVWGTNVNNVWAVGGAGTIRKWNGTSWSAQTSGTTSALQSIWGTDANNIWAVGSAGAILRWNGTTWTAQSSGTSAFLYGVWGTDVNNVWVVGMGAALKWNGTRWESHPSTLQTANGVWSSDPSNVWKVGTGGAILKFNGTAPTVENRDPAGIGMNNATLRGLVTANLSDAAVSFLYGTPGNMKTVSGSPSIVIGATPASVSATLSGLLPGTTYQYQLKAVNAIGQSITTGATFTTAANPPPSGGAFAVTPDVAAPGAAVQLAAPGWTDLHTPLTYQFFLNGAPLNTAGTSSTLSIAAPTTLNTYTLKVRIADALGASTEATASLVVNNPPVVRHSTLGATGGSTAEIAVAKLLRYASDPDGDAMQVIAVSPLSAQGGAVALLNGVIHYTAPAGYSGPDSFTYTIRDASGSTATGVVNVTVAPGSAPSLNVVSIAPTPDGFLVRFAGIPGASYQIQYRDALAAPWQLLNPPGTIVAGPNGSFEYEDKPNPKPASRFYRAVAP